MGNIKEPEGVNFVVENKGLNDTERLLINQLIEQSKGKRKRRLPKASSLPQKKKEIKIKTH